MPCLKILKLNMSTGNSLEQQVKSPGSAQRFLSIHSAVYNTFYVQRHLISRKTLRKFRGEAMSVWEAATAAA